VVADGVDEREVQRKLEEAQAELAELERGESDADRWQVEQKILHAENQLRVLGRV
jgi:F0F1-type ATP synthase epsilon subunit